MIKNQVDLPFGVAVGIVMQGIRIRFGRSLVTLTGIILGIAFMMSNLTQQIIREGVREEDQMRAEIQRMYSFMTSEIGLVEGRSIGLVSLGAADETETRFLARLSREGATAMEVSGASADQEFDAYVILGRGANAADNEKPRPQRNDLSATVASAPVFTTIDGDDLPSILPGRAIVNLSEKPRPEEIARLEAQKKKDKFRRAWILVISILVTVMGIANAMLMSVTERFREIGTMKCLGAKSTFVRRLFLIESSFLGVIGGVLGALLGSAFSILVNIAVYGFSIVMQAINPFSLISALLICIVAGVFLSIVAAIYPAGVAAAMTPAHALRSNV